jgi:hypothetical protein
MIMINTAILILAAAAQEAQPIDEGVYAEQYMKIVRAYEDAEKLSKTSPAAALDALEREVFPKLPNVFEARIVVKYTKGLTKGEEKERHDFFPYRLAGECALAANELERAVKYLEKSPSSAALLAKAKKALAEKEKKTDPPPTPALEKPLFTVAPLLEKRDYIGALEALRKERDHLKDYEARVKEVRDEASSKEKSATAAFAAALPRVNEADFRKDHLEPCLTSCSRVPPDLETNELRWIRRLGEWMSKRDPAERDLLALEAAKFAPEYHVVCEQAQKARLAEIETLVEEARQSSRAERQPVLERLEAAERAFRKLSAARPYKELDDSVARALARRPVDNEKLNDARKGVSTVREVRVLASQLDLLWTSPDRAKLADQDQKDLALYLGIYRSCALFLDGKTIDEVSQDLRIIEVFRNGPALPKTVSPKVASVLDRVRSGR